MTNNRFISVLMTMFLLLAAVFGSSGCGGGGSSISTDNEANNHIQRPEQDTTPDPEPTPEPTPTPVVYYTVTFDSQGGNSVPSQRVKSGDTVTKPVDPVRNGYSFAGWYKSANGTTQFTFGSGGDKVTKDITLYAKWSEAPKPEIYYTVTFDSNGGSSVASQSVIAGGTVTRPADPVKEGYTFNGWFLANKQFKFGTGGDKITGDITLIAGWMIVNYTVTFDSQGGSSVPNQSVSYGGTIPKPADPAKNGYTFSGWYKDSTLTEAFRFGSNGDKVTSNLTLYAKWSISDSSRADIAVKKISIGYQEGDSAEHVTGNIVLPSNIDVSGDLVNIAWTSNNPDVISTNGTVKRQNNDVTVRLTATITVGTVKRSVIFNVTVTHDPRLAPIIPSEFTVSFIDYDGSEIEIQIVSDEEKAIEPKEPEREGYLFTGWLGTDGFLYNFDSPVYEDIVLAANYAELEEVTDIELEALMQSVDIEGEFSVSFDVDSLITGMSISYNLDGIGTVTAELISQDKMLGTAGLIGSPVSIRSVGSDVKKATITFNYDPEFVSQRAIELCNEYMKLSIDIDINNVDMNDLAVVWYDESNDIVILLEDSRVDIASNTITTMTTHFSKFGVVLRNIWDAVWNKRLPAVRTESTPYYDVIIGVDCSGSMYFYNKMEQTVNAIQGLIDILADNDSIIIYGAYTSARINVLDTKTKLVSGGIDRRAEIKSRVASVLIDDYSSNVEALPYSYWSEISTALRIASELNSNNSLYQQLIIMISDGQPGIDDAVLQMLKDNGQKVIAVGIGRDAQSGAMEHIANVTGGSYLFCENASDLQDAFLDLQSTYIGSTKDTDGDGLPDLVETSGMRDQYGRIWRTNPNMSDSDGDGYSDGEEMGDYKSLFVDHPYFTRVSNPNKITFKVSMPLLPELPKETYYDTKAEKASNVITLWCNTEDPAYLETAERETIYTISGNLSIELIDIPSGFKLEEISTEEIDQGDGNILYKTTARLSYFQDANLSGAKWKITANGRLGSPWTVNVNPKQVKYTVNHDLLQDAESCMEKLEKEFITQLCGDANSTKSSETQSLQDLKREMTATRVSFSLNRNKYTASNIPDEVYETFARAIIDSITGSNVDRYNFDLDKPTLLPEQIYKQLKRGMNSDNFTVTLGEGSNRRTYSVNYSVTAISFLGASGGYAEATVSWRESYGQESWMLVWASNPKAGLNAMANYCAVLVQLELDVWKDFLAAFVSDIFGLKKSNVRNALYVAEDVIQAMCGDINAANALANGTDNMKLKQLIREGFKNFVLKFFPQGKKFVDIAYKLDSTIRRRKTLEKAMADYNTDKDKKKADAEIAYAYKRFKADYYKLKEIDLFNGKFPELKIQDYTFPEH